MPSTIINDGQGASLHDVRAFGADIKLLTGKFDIDENYATGGISFNLSGYFPKQVLGALFQNKDGYLFEYDEANKKLKIYTAQGAEVVDATALSITGIQFVAWGH